MAAHKPGLEIDLAAYTFRLLFQYPPGSSPLVQASLHLRYNLWSDPGVWALLYPDASKPHLNHPEQWIGTPEAIADHALHLLEKIFASGQQVAIEEMERRAFSVQAMHPIKDKRARLRRGGAVHQDGCGEVPAPWV
jgi:hypothetical protein